MENMEENNSKEILRKEKLKNEEITLMSKEKERTKSYFAREQKIEEAQKIKENKRADAIAKEEIKEQVKDKARKEAYLAREKILAEEQANRQSKNNFKKT